MNRREFLKKGLEGIVVASLGLGATKTFGDGGFISPYERDVYQPNQMAVIKYDKGIEDIIFKVKYEGNADDFGWIIPVPSLPKLDTKSEDFDGIFFELADLTHWHRGWGKSYDNPIDVVEETTVGIYNVAVLHADNPNALSDWLSQHNYNIPSGGENIINEYINKGWYFIASRIIPKKLEEKGSIHPIHLTFNSSQIVYPMKISSISAKKYMQVLLYVLTNHEISKKSDSNIRSAYYGFIDKEKLSENFPILYKFIDKNYILSKLRLIYQSTSDMDKDIVLKKEIINPVITPKNYLLSQNYPNPFNEVTNIKYKLPYFSSVELKIYNILGQEIETLVNENQSPGEHKIEFNGNKLPSGVYMYKLKTHNFVSTKRMILLK